MTDWPLALCDAQTVDMDRDFVATDVVARDGFTENYQIYFNPEHKWYYLNKQLPSEVIIFRQTDTEERFATGMSSPKGRPNQMETDSHPGVPHAGFRNPLSLQGEIPRESVEARAFIYY